MRTTSHSITLAPKTQDSFALRAACLLVAFSVLLTGCSSLGHMTSGPADRQQTLNTVLPEFHRALYWGKFQEAAVYVVPEKRSTFVNKLVASRRAENLVELEVGNIDFNAESDSAKVDVVVKFFKNTNYSVVSRLEKETWNFSRTEGWLFQSSEDLGLIDTTGHGPTSQRGES